MKRNIIINDYGTGEMTNSNLSIDENGTLYIDDMYGCVYLSEILFANNGEMFLSRSDCFLLDETETEDYEFLYYQDINNIEYGNWDPEGTTYEISEDGLCLSEDGVLIFMCYDWFSGNENKILDARKYNKIGNIIYYFSEFMKDREKKDINILKINSSAINECLGNIFDIINADTIYIYHDGKIGDERDTVQEKAKTLMSKGANKGKIIFKNSGIDKTGKIRNL